MGASVKKKKLILMGRPKCFLCNISDATTVDHVPSRECFKDKIGPEGFEFPACHECNQKYSKFEQIVALYIRMFDFDEDGFSNRQINRLLNGVRNNNPNYLPEFISSNMKRRGIKQGHLKLGNYSSLSELSMVGIPTEIHNAIEIFSRKLTCALYYKHCRKPVPLEYFIMTMGIFASEKRSDEAVQRFSDMLPDYFLGSRINTNIGEQFHYKYGVKNDGLLFAFVAQFSKSIFVFGGVSVNPGEEGNGWKAHKTDFQFSGNSLASP